MPQRAIHHATIIGLGLLGGSLALALKKRNPRVRIAGVGRRQANLDEAIKLGAIDSAHLDPAQAVADSDLIVLATPVGAFERHLRAIRGRLKPSALVTDVGSTKAGVVKLAEGILGRAGPFIGSHPMAGSERKGVRFARADLFQGATCILTPTAAAPPWRIARAAELWESLGMTVVRMTPADHDRALAAVSHLPHLIAGLLMLLPKDSDLAVAAGGLRDTTRLASGDPEMWRDILLDNRKEILAALNRFDRSLHRLMTLVESDPGGRIARHLSAAKSRRDATIGAELL